MRFLVFEAIMSPKRIRRYVNACGGDTLKAMTLYRYNLKLSLEMFSVISCYEVALRNAIDMNMTKHFGPHWLRDSILPGGIFDNPVFSGTSRIIKKVYADLMGNNLYVFNEMDAINRLRNRIAHHEPVCFNQDSDEISTVHLQNCYSRIMDLFSWMDFHPKSSCTVLTMY